MSREILYGGATAVLSAYLGFTAAETYLFSHKGQHLFSFHDLAKLWAVPAVLILDIIFYGKYKYEAGMRKNGCKPGIVYKHRDPILGTDYISAVMKAMKENKGAEFWDEKFKTVGDTYRLHILGESVLMTNEPENVKAILATKFDDWPITGPRQLTTILAVGPRAIFSANGPEWQHARAMIRPSFVRNQIADLACFDRHVTNFLARIPKDGSEIDLQSLFYMMTMDSSTDFM
jgi:hypothetical protein